MQIGADIYFDTSLIAAELERRHPSPSFYPAGGEAMAQIFTAWADQNLFLPAANFSLSLVADKLPAAFFEDRAKMMNRPVTPIDKMKAATPLFKMQMCLQLDRLDQSARRRAQLPARATSPASPTSPLQHPLWMAGKNSGKRSAAAFDPYPARARVDRSRRRDRPRRAHADRAAKRHSPSPRQPRPRAPRASEEIEGAPKLGSRMTACRPKTARPSRSWARSSIRLATVRSRSAAARPRPATWSSTCRARASSSDRPRSRRAAAGGPPSWSRSAPSSSSMGLDPRRFRAGDAGADGLRSRPRASGLARLRGRRGHHALRGRPARVRRLEPRAARASRRAKASCSPA